MQKKDRLEPALALIHTAAAQRKAASPLLLDLRPLTPFTDFFYICHSESSRQSRAIADGIREALEKAGSSPFHLEGLESAEWILIDAGDVVIHIFLSEEKREFYSLERLWADAEQIPLPETEPAL